MLLGPEAVVLSQKDYRDLKAEYGLDLPLRQQYRDYWSNIVHGHLGYSYHHRLPVSQVIAEHLDRSLRLLIPAVLLSTIAAAILGTAAGWRAVSIAAKFLLMRNSVFQAKTEDYVLYARAKGISSWKIPYVHIFRNHSLGTNDMGNDILTALMHAGRISLMIGIGAALASLLIGTAIGLLAGYSCGIQGEILTGHIDTVLLIPILPLLVVLAAYLGQSVFNIILVIALLGWCSTARAVRAKVFQLRESNFVEAIQALGFSGKRILFCHILPSVSEIISAKFVLSVAGAMLSEAALSFLGFGAPHRFTCLVQPWPTGSSTLPGNVSR